MNILQSLRDFIDSSKRVLIISRKPEWKEYSAMVKVTGLGIIIIGIIGYLVLLVLTLLGI